MYRLIYEMQPKYHIVFKAVFLRQIQLILKNIVHLLNFVTFLVLSSSIASILLHNFKLNVNIAYGLIILFFTLSLSYFNVFFFENDYKKGVLSRIYMCCNNLEHIILAKFFAIYIIIVPLMIIISPFLLMIFNISDKDYNVFTFSNIVIITYNTMIITALLLCISVFSNTLIINAGKSIVAAIISISLSFPIILLSAISLTNGIYAVLLLILLLIFLPLVLCFSNIVIKSMIIED